MDILKSNKWESFLDTPITKLAKTYYSHSPSRYYHNWDHILKLFYHARVTFGFTFDINLALAILFHDAIYDNSSDKEKRSANLFLDVCAVFDPMDGVDQKIVYDMIMATSGHDCSTGDYRIIMLDLADLADPEATITNHKNICMESMSLYNVDELTMVQNSTTFMEFLRQTVCLNKKGSAKHAKFWDDVITGIDSSITLYDHIL